jgi:hypothetical protein
LKGIEDVCLKNGSRQGQNLTLAGFFVPSSLGYVVHISWQAVLLFTKVSLLVLIQAFFLR